ncbi:protein kinase [Corallococcus exiguus]|uniref:protein kinase domain-containing protein n=1 Tax=Corallococcus exiguus TaxID=83462 RepID=UPI001A8DFA92|nr:protein kinase [Corallococcus exiguus]MBN8468880.1 protein kinase [Corallococcus exiguus]
MDAPPHVDETLFTEKDSSLEDPRLLELASGVLGSPLPALGERLGGRDGQRYEALEVLGSGGMGQVFRALDHELQRAVTLKFLHSGVKSRTLSLLREEARALARLDHEHIVRIHDVAEWHVCSRQGESEHPRSVPFLVMEYLEGRALRELLRHGRLELRRALDIMTDVATGLAHAHERHLVHLDLKPDNVLLVGGHAKLLDFGLARLIADASRLPCKPRVGTPAYMAPEQWRGAPLNARTDVWAAGLLLFEMLTGASPFPRAGRRELRERVISSEPMPLVRTRRPELPEEVESLVARALAKALEARFSHGTELVEQLRTLKGRLGWGTTSLRDRIAERRQVTLVACGLVLTGEPSEALSSEDESELEAAFHRASANLLREHGGTLTAFVGSEVHACFGASPSQEDDSERAVRAALQLKEVLPRELSSRTHQELRVRVGVHTGMVTLDNAPPGAHEVMLAIQGEAPKVAAWLVSQAPPDAVLVSDDTDALVRARFETQLLDSRIFEGLLGARALGLHQVLCERRDVVRFDRALVGGSLTPLVGRKSEMRWLVELGRRALSGEGAFVLLQGEAGIGKSRLVQELNDWKTREAWVWARCQCLPQFQSSAFHPFIDWLRRFLPREPGSGSVRPLRELEALLETLGMPPTHLHSLASLLSLPIPADAPFLLLTPEKQREKILDGLRTLILSLAAKRPLVLLVEDVHWADPSTLQFLDSLIADIGAARACVLLTARSGFQHGWAGRPEFHELKVERLSPADTAALVRRASRGRALPPEALQRLAARADGIPLFVEELTRMVLEHWDSDRASSELFLDAIPASLQELLLARLDRLPPQLKALTQQSAVLGREFPYEMLRATSSMNEHALRQELTQLELAGVLFRNGDASNLTYVFKHTLIRDAAYQSMLRGSRQRYHAQAFQVLSEQFPEIEAEQPEVLAQHASQAELLPQAVNLWQSAGERAGTQAATPEAIHAFNGALQQLARLPRSRERDQREVALCSELGMALISARGFAAKEVEETYARARALCEQFGELPLPVLWGVWVIALVRGDREGTAQIGTLFQRILKTQRDPVSLVVVRSALASLSFWRGEYLDCQRHCLSAKALLGTSAIREMASAIRGSPQGYVSEEWLNMYLYLAAASIVMGEAERASEELQHAFEFAEAMHHPYALATALIFGAAIALEAGEVEVALDRSARAVALSREHGFAYILATGRCNQGLALALLGDAQQGIEACQEGLALLRIMGAVVVLPLYSAALARACLEGGRLEEGLSAVREGLEVAGTSLARGAIPELRRMEGELLLARGNEPAARAALRQAVVTAHDCGAKLHELRAATSLARLLRRAGEDDAGRSLLEEIRDRFPEGCTLVDYQEAGKLLRLASPA